jgi:nitroimidazol reductase NimA-like FMN-containing flavoprotein (pyridoxamine 5'-phosphate oxidase superfamily)
VAREVANHTVLFTQAERNFLKENEACSIATCHNDEPHIAPVSYIFEENSTSGHKILAV